MNAETLYQEMKNALTYFGLRFNEKAEMSVELGADCITFRHAGREVTVHDCDDEDEPADAKPMCGACGQPSGWCGQC